VRARVPVQNAKAEKDFESLWIHVEEVGREKIRGRCERAGAALDLQRAARRDSRPPRCGVSASKTPAYRECP